MKFADFLDKHNIKLDSIFIKIHQDGYKEMCKNKDPHHSGVHIDGMLDELDKFVGKEKSVNTEDINFNILMSAIAWHDVWKGSEEQTRNLIKFIVKEIYDGYGSAREFRDYIKKEKINITPHEVKKIVHCIVRHSRPLPLLPWGLADIVLPVKSLEAKIMIDIDFLDGWSKRRFNNLTGHYLHRNKKFDPKLLIIAKWWFTKIMISAKPNHLFFNYSKKEFRKRKKIIIKECLKLWKEKEKYLDINSGFVKSQLKINKEKLYRQFQNEGIYDIELEYYLK